MLFRFVKKIAQDLAIANLNFEGFPAYINMLAIFIFSNQNIILWVYLWKILLRYGLIRFVRVLNNIGF
jgi:hypothetical protein